MKNDFSEKRILIAICSIFSILLIDSLHVISIPQTALLIIIMIIPFFLGKEEIVAYAISFSMLGTRIQVAYICASCLINLLIKNKFKMNFSMILTIGLFAFTELINVLKYPNDNLAELLRYLIVYSFVLYSLLMDITQNGKRVIINSFIISTSLYVIIVLIETLALTGWNFAYIFNGAIRLGYSEQLGGNLLYSADPNLLGQGCSLVIALCIVLIFFKKIKYIIPLIICFFAGAMTLSKTFLLSLVLIFILTFLLCGDYHNPLKSFAKRFSILALIVIIIFSIYKIYPSYFDNIMNRIDKSDITTGRTEIALKYIEVIFSKTDSLFRGIGIQNVGEKTGIISSPHTAIVEIFICWGIIGLLFIISYFIYLMRKHISTNERFNKLNLIPIIVFVFVTQSTQFFRVRDHILCLIVILLSCGLNLNWREKNE